MQDQINITILNGLPVRIAHTCPDCQKSLVVP